jgi:hypothetical protein
MLTLDPIGSEFVPHTKRPVLVRNEALFVDSAQRDHTGIRVVRQDARCAGRANCTPCYTYPNGTQLFCIDGECVGTASDCPFS